VNVLEVVGGWLTIAWFGVALAIFLGALSEKTELVEKIWHPVSYLAFPLSGAAFMVDSLPAFVQKLVLYIPMVNGVEIVREGYFGNAVKAHYDLPYLLTCCAVLTFAALAQVSQVARNITPE
jgi:ABC-2 type transport system permease protein/capsular polysaccharide transport system permease protein